MFQSPIVSSTPNSSRELCELRLSADSDAAPADRAPSPPIVVSEDSDGSLPCICSACGEGGHFHVDRRQSAPSTADVDIEVKPKCQSRSCSAKLNESIGSSSLAGSAASEARSRCLENKLSATLEVLKNKEETVRVQAESLALAEARIAALAARAQPARRHGHTQSLHCTRSSADGCCVETADVIAQTQDADDEVSALRDNLSIVEDLYRDCFYETAKQEGVIEALRQSCLDVRLLERRKDARIARLQRALHAHAHAHTHAWPLDRCQDIALEVENLKSEISNFLNSSNHDSGMWERTEEPLAAELADDLHHIAGQLLQLRDLLRDGCSCGLEDENMKLKRINETLEIQLGELRQRVSELEAALEDKENVDQQHQHQIQLKEQELGSLQQQLAALQAAAAEHRASCDCLDLQVQQLQVMLQDRSEELERAHQTCEEQEATISRLRLELGKAETTSKESEKVRQEVVQLSAAVGSWRAQLAGGRRRLRALDAQLQRERRHCQHLEIHYQEKVEQAAELQRQLAEAHARGAALCEDSQRAVCGVRRWMRRARDKHREQETMIEEQNKLIMKLQLRQQSDSEPCCSRWVRDAGASETTSSSRGPAADGERAGVSETGSCTRCLAESETASCRRCPSVKRDARTSVSDTSGRSAPTPPRRAKRKPLCDDRECQWPAQRDAGSQWPARRDARTRPDARTRDVSSTDEVLERLDRAHEALAEARRRWRLGASAADVRRGT